MKLRSTPAGYGLVAIMLHWAMAVLFLSQAGLGLTMVRLEDQRRVFELVQWHKSIGLLVLLLAVLRLGWRLTSTVPELPPDLPGPERMAARWSHRILYLLLIAQPITGWVLVSVSTLGVPTLAFGLFLVPHLPFGPGELAEASWAWVHRLLAYATMALVAVHVAAALRHQFWLGNGLLWRMIVPDREG